MAEKMSSVIQEVTINGGTFHEETFTPSYINFFFGKNGSGKTSISREFESGTGLKWAEGAIPSNYQIHVFNQDYTDLRLKTLDKMNGIFTMVEGDAVEDAAAKIAQLEEQRKEITARLNQITGKDGEKEKVMKSRQDALTTFQDACLRNTKNLREKLKVAMKGALRNPQLSQRIESAAPREVDVDELEKLCQTAFDKAARPYPFFTEIDGEEQIAKVPVCDLLCQSIISSGNTVFASFVKNLRSLPWIEQGHRAFHEKGGGLCPYCHQQLPADFEEQLASCYDDAYQKAIERLTAFRQAYRAHMGVIFSILKNATVQETLPSLAEHVAALQPQIDNFSRAVQANLAIIDQKIADPAKSVELEDLTPMLLDLAAALEHFNVAIQKNNDVVEKQEESQKECTRDAWALLAFHMQGEVETYHLALDNARKKDSELNAEVAGKQKRLEEIGREIEALGKASTTTRAAIDGMNRLLKDSGFEGFEIVKSDAAPNAYKVVRGDKKLAGRLSEGEMHFLAFLYFYNQVKGCDENGVLQDKIVVIDDPVSSLDDNARFIIGSLVREMIEVCYNNTDYRGQTVKGDYIKQLFILTHNPQFHRSITYNQVGRYRCTNFYKINKVNNISTITSCIRQSKTEAGEKENYNPVKNAYAALWSEFQYLQNEIPLMNVIHRILDFYFLDMCGKDGMSLREEILVKERDKFIKELPDGKTDMTLFHLADSMLQYMAAGVEGDMTFVSDGANVEQIKETFEMIFRRLGQGAHFDMMMERSR